MALLFLAVITAAINLRAGIATVAPVLSDIVADFDAGGAFAGIVTGLPGAFFAAMGLLAVPLARAVGLSRALLIGMIAALVGTAWRPWVGQAWAFVALSALVVGGIALANVLLPVWIKRYGGSHVVALMTVNTSLLGASEAVAPLSSLLYSGPHRWQYALFFWVWIALAQVLVWLAVAWRTGFDFPSANDDAGASDDAADASGRADGATGEAVPKEERSASEQQRLTRQRSILTSPTALFLMVFFGVQSMNAYVQMGFLPQIFTDAGASDATGSVALAVVGGLNIVGGLVMPQIIARVNSLAPTVIVMAACAAGGYAGLIVAADAAPMLWAVLLGLGGWAFPTALALIVARTRSAQVTARVSGFVQPVGYVLSAIGPFFVGLAYTPEDPNWGAILGAFVAASIIQGVVGVFAARPRLIDDELAAA